MGGSVVKAVITVVTVSIDFAAEVAAESMGPYELLEFIEEHADILSNEELRAVIEQHYPQSNR